MIAKVIQYLRPNGRQVTCRVPIPDDCQKQYNLIHACGCILTCEQMMSGQAVQYISNADGDFDVEITAGDTKAALTALIKMIEAFDKAKFEKWNKQFTEANNGP